MIKRVHPKPLDPSVYDRPLRARLSLHQSLGVLLLLLLQASVAFAEEISLANYIRSDSDRTTVIAPRLRVDYPIVEGTTVDAVYAVDIWSSASIDIRTSASKVPVTEQRDEFDLSVTQVVADGALSASYRNSSEPDYQSHGGSLGFTYDFASRNSTLALGVSGSRDAVGRADWAQWQRDLVTFGGRFAFTQVIDVDTLAMIMYEPQYVSGFQSSAYRRVAIGGNLANCWGPPEPPRVDGMPVIDPSSANLMRAPLCTEEANPEKRLRHAFAARARRALGEHMSMGVAYRLYLDSWGLLSHTVQADLVYLFVRGTHVALGYRFYVQGSADHYKPIYYQPERYMTSDKELSALSSHRVSLEFEHVFSGNMTDPGLRLNVSVAPSIYFYNEFPLLKQIRAIDLNGALTWVF